MTETQSFTDNNNHKQSQLIFVVIIVFTGMLPILLFLFSLDTPASMSTADKEFYNASLPIILISIGILELFVIFRYFLPKAEQAK